MSDSPPRRAMPHGDDQAAGLRRLFGTSAVTLAVAAREAAVIDAYTLIKRIVSEEGSGCFKIAITHARSAEEAQILFENMRRVAHEYLGVRLEYIGMAAVQGQVDGGAAAVAPARVSGAALHDSVI